MKERSTKQPTKWISAEEFDQKFDRGENVSEYVDWNRAKAVYPNSEVAHDVVCACQRTRAASRENATLEFKMLRESCAALRMILVPNLPKWEKACADLARDDSGHRSILLCAFERGHLHRLTLPIHKYLLTGDNPRQDLRGQYLQDLQERWFFEPDRSKRHRGSKRYLGRLVEFLIANWLETERGLDIVALEATGADHDIVVRASNDVETAIEVKFIGTEDSDFELLQTMQDFGGPLDVETARDFLLTRIFEAGEQLAPYRGRKAAIAVIDDFFSDALQAALRLGYIDWQNPKLGSRSEKWLEHWDKLKITYPAIESEFARTLASLNDIWILKLMADETLEIAFPMAR